MPLNKETEVIFSFIFSRECSPPFPSLYPLFDTIKIDKREITSAHISWKIRDRFDLYIVSSIPSQPIKKSISIKSDKLIDWILRHVNLTKVI